MTLKSKFTLLFVLLIGVLTFIFSVLVYEQVQSHLLSQAEDDLSRFLEHEIEHWKNSAQRHTSIPDRGIFFTVRKNGKLLWSTLPAKVTDILSKTISREVGQDSFEYVAHHNLKEERSQLTALKAFLFAAGTIVFFLTAPLAYFAAWTQLFPFRVLASATRNFTADNLYRRLSVPKHTDEYGLLIRSFNHLFERLQGSFEELQRYAQDVSHEFRTPLSVIAAQAESALKKENDRQATKDALEKILNQARKLDQMAAHLLALGDVRRWARNECSKPIDIEAASTDLAWTIQRKPWATEKGFSITAHEMEQGTLVETNEELFVTVVGNLLENAFFFAHSKVSVSLEIVDSRLEVTVEDDGPGVSADNRRKVFEPFFTRRPGGHGLGLTIVKAAVEATGGEIYLEESVLGGLMARACLSIQHTI